MRIRGLKTAVRHHVIRAVERLDPQRYRQEPAYVAALFARLDAVVLDRPEARVEFRSTIVEDHGPNSAESIWGADFGVIASLTQPNLQLHKAVIGQAKRESLISLPQSKSQQFREQVAKMWDLTHATVGLEVPKIAGEMPLIRIVEATTIYGDTWVAQSMLAPRQSFEQAIRPLAPDQGPTALIWAAISLDDYLCDQIVGCLHGDRAESLVHALANSNLTTLHINAKKGT